MPICILCDQNEVSEKARLPTCANCRASVHNWEKRRPAEVLQRRRNLAVYDARMQQVNDSDLNYAPPKLEATQLRLKPLTRSQLKVRRNGG